MILRAVLLVWSVLVAGAFPAWASVEYPDEPSGYSPLVRHEFINKTNSGACNDYYPTGGGASIRTDGGGFSLSTPNYMRNIKPAGASHGGTVVECLFAPQRNLFWGFEWKSSNPFGGYNNAANKLAFMMTNRPTGGGALWGLHYWGASAGSRKIGVFLQASTGVNNCHLSAYVGSCDGTSVVFLPNVDTSPILEGVPHRVQITMRRSSSESSRDGVIRVVVDGVVRTHYTNVNFPAWDFISVQNNSTWDGQCALRLGGNPATPTVAPNDCRPYDDWHDWNDWYVSGSVGSGGSNPTPTTPGTVSNLSLSTINTTSLNAQFTTAANTESYEIRYAPGTIEWGAAQQVSNGSCAVPFVNNTAGQGVQCTITGLLPDTQYQVQLVGKLGTTYGLLSNAATGRTSVLPSGGGGGTPTSTTTTYSYVAQYSGTQGQSGWSYRDALGNLLTHTAGNWVGAQPYQGAWSTGFHPGNSVGTVIRWTAPSSGDAAVTGSVRVYNHTCSGGVVFEARVNGVLKFTQTIGAAVGTEYPYSFTQTTASGDTFDFIVLPNGSNTCDSTQLNPSIAFTTGGVGGVAAPTLTGFTPLSGLVGSTVTITGTNFGSTPSSNTVKFNGTTAVVTAASTTTLTVTVPVSATAGTLSVETAGGTVVSAGSFTVSSATVQPVPHIINLLSTDTYRVINGTDVWDLRGSASPFVLYRNGSCGACNLVGYSLVYSAALNTVGLEFIPGKYMYWDTDIKEWVIISGSLPYTPPIQVIGSFTFTGNAAAGFNVYRSDVAGGVKTKLPIILAYADRTYTDTQHSWGCFEVAAYGQNGEEGPHSTETCTLHGRGLSREIGLLNPLLVVDFKGRVWELRGSSAPYVPYIDEICRCSLAGYSLRYVEGEAQLEFLPGKWMRFDDTLDDWVIVAP